MNKKKVKISKWRTRGGKHRTIKLYAVWANMKQRCTNPNDSRYKHYGARGITICSEWVPFSGFRAWAVKHGFGKALTIERVNNDGDYCPENCTWIPMADQQRNQSTTRKITLNGETKCLREWARCIGITPMTLIWRIDNWPLKKALTHEKSW